MNEIFLERAHQELCVLSSKYSNQALYLESLGNPCVDDLAEDFGDTWDVIKHDIGDSHFRKSLFVLREKLSSMSGASNASLWTHEALETSKEWQDVRTLAKKCLDCFPINSLRNDK